MGWGIRSDDKSIAVNGKKIDVWGQFVEYVRRSKGKPLDLEIQRKGQVLRRTVTPVQGVTETGEPYYQIGVSPQEEVAYRRGSFYKRLRGSFCHTADVSRGIFALVGGLFSRPLFLCRRHPVALASHPPGRPA